MKNKFIKNVITIAKGTAIGQIILFAASPLLSRLYTPEEYGILATYTIFISTLSILSTLKLELSMQTEVDNTKAFFLIKIALYFNMLFSIILLLLFYTFNETLCEVFQISQEYSWFLYLIPFGVFALGLNKINSSLYIRNGEFNKLKDLFISNSIIMVLIQIGFGILKIIPSALIIGDASARLVTNIKAFYANVNFRKTGKINIESLKRVMVEKKDYMLFSTTSEFFYILVSQSIPFLIVLYFNPKLAGFYAFGMKIVNAPMVLIGKSISQVYISEIRTITDNLGKIEILFNKIVMKLFLVTCLPYVLLLIFGSGIFSFIFGSEWEYSGKLMSIMSILFLIEIVVYPLMVTLEILNKQKILLVWQLVRGIQTFLVFHLFSKISLSLESVLITISISQGLLYIFIFFYMKNLLKEKVKKNEYA
ncbi:lipopolysaccharide biosynthesis protein [Psychrobacillus sp. NPDC096389]|uniref:lipopolysaccharide biosynthesis protein n=1 Tax=Psychrobacillus sp. NPDC096389 TaxID=3364490 RepID=UPI0037F4014E